MWHRIASRWFSNISSEGDSRISLGNLHHLPSKVLAHVQMEIPVNPFLPLVWLLVPTEQSLALSSWHSPFRYWQTLMRSPLRLLILRLNSLSSLSLSSWKRCSCPLTVFVALCQIRSRSSMALLYWGTHLACEETIQTLKLGLHFFT